MSRDRVVIDDPHATSTPEQVERCRRAFLNSLDRVRLANVPPVIIMARLNRAR